MWTRSKCRRCQTDIPSVLQGKSKQADLTKAGAKSSDSFSSGECEDKVLAHKSRWEKRQLRELREENKRPKKEGRQFRRSGKNGSG